MTTILLLKKINAFKVKLEVFIDVMG